MLVNICNSLRSNNLYSAAVKESIVVVAKSDAHRLQKLLTACGFDI
jgi:hypothetical protein